MKATARFGALIARHPWSHNDHFHSWILANLPRNRRSAMDFGCGRGGLLAALAPHFEQVHGIDLDPAMRAQAAGRCTGLSNAEVTDTDLAQCCGPYDLVTMVAVLHHLDIDAALLEVRRLLAPGGRFLAVGLAHPRTLPDYAWELASVVTNPLIGYVKHPWPNVAGPQPPPSPLEDPTLSFDEVRDIVQRVMPGATMRHHVGFRHTIAWERPASDA